MCARTRGPRQTPPRAWRAPVLEFLETSAADFLSELHRRDSDQRCWTWYPEDQTAGFWARRMAHETVIHRWDAEHSFQQPTPIATEVAADAIDELLVVFLSGDWSDDPQQGPVGNVDVVSGSIRWRVSLKAESVGVVRSQLSRGDEPMANAQLEGPSRHCCLACGDGQQHLHSWPAMPP